MYFPAIDSDDGMLAALEMVPLRFRNMRLNRSQACRSGISGKHFEPGEPALWYQRAKSSVELFMTQ
jgi:hypothetical protein